MANFRANLARMYFETIRQMHKMLGQLSKWLDAAAAFAATRKFDPANLLPSRLAPDQFPFVKQVQSACDTAKLAAARLTGRQAPSHPDTEKSLDELQARIRTVQGYLDEFSPADFETAATRIISNPRWEGKVMSGADYLREHGIPNFYFHASHAYALLRHNGVSLGKVDFLGPISLKAP
jgi:uncharacterized protein